MYQAQTTVSFEGTKILINGELTYKGRKHVEGLLFNVRTVNATFDDTLGKVDWWDDDGSQSGNDHAGYGKWSSPHSAFANTERYIKGLSDYRAHGILFASLSSLLKNVNYKRCSEPEFSGRASAKRKTVD